MNKKITVKSLAKSGWIDDLSEEEEKMLYKTHALDEKLRNNKVIKKECLCISQKK